MSSRNLRNKQSGLSLIELMVAMLIGLFLILGVTQIFISNQASYLFQQGQMGNQENGRFALTLLNQELVRAGYRSNLATGMPADNSLSGCNFKAGAGVAPASTAPVSSLCIQYQAANRADVTCQGSSLVAADKAAITAPYSNIAYQATTRPRIVEKISFEANTNSITCTTGVGSQQLVTGVRDLRFEYGTADALDEDREIKNFSTALPDGTIVGVVRYSILMQSPGTSRIRDDTSAISPVLKDWNTRYGTTYNDTASIYQIVQGTTMIRNIKQ